MRPQPMLVVRDVEASSLWYQQVLGCISAHGGTEYERLVDADGALIMQLHHWDSEHHHGTMGDPDTVLGNGVLLWFEIDDFDDAVARATALDVNVMLGPCRNPPEGEPGGPAHRELWFKDLDGYTVVVASPDGEAA